MGVGILAVGGVGLGWKREQGLQQPGIQLPGRTRPLLPVRGSRNREGSLVPFFLGLQGHRRITKFALVSTWRATFPLGRGPLGNSIRAG